MDECFGFAWVVGGCLVVLRSALMSLRLRGFFALAFGFSEPHFCFDCFLLSVELGSALGPDSE